MKNIVLVFGLTILVNPVQAQGTLSPAPSQPTEFTMQKRYFRLLDLAHPTLNAGTFLDLKGNVAAGFEVAVITHSARDGYFILPGEDWTLLAVGFLTGPDKAVAIGPSVNLSGPVKAVLLAGVNYLAPNDYANLKGILAPAQEGGRDVSLSLGPALVVKPFEGFRSYVRLFLGGAWKF